MSITKKDKRLLYYKLGDGNWLSGKLSEPEGLTKEFDRFVSKDNNEAWEWDLETEVYEITKKKHGFDRDTINDLEDKYFDTSGEEKEKILKEWRKKNELFEKEKSKLEKEKQEFYDTIRKKRYK